MLALFLVQATVNGEVIGQFDSNPATPFTTYRFQGVGVQTMTFSTVGLTEDDWISFSEVGDYPFRLSYVRPLLLVS